MPSKHQFDLKKNGNKTTCPGGSRTLLTSKSMKSLKGMAIASLVLKKGGVREPHWHPNASELAYCIQGKALITMFSPRNARDTFTLEEGEIAYFPRGYLHHIENISHGESSFIIAYNNDAPEDLDLSASINSMSVHVLASTFSGEEALFRVIKKHGKDTFISQRTTIAKPPHLPGPNRYKLNLERTTPPINTKAGNAQVAHCNNFPLLEHLCLFNLRIFKNGIREPHWHPNATELNYVISGKAKVTILSPGGDLETMELTPGQGSVIPAGYFHSIENTSPKELHMAVYFNTEAPEDIGLSGAMSAYSKETLASLFDLDEQAFSNLKQFSEDRMIVSGKF